MNYQGTKKLLSMLLVAAMVLSVFAGSLPVAKAVGESAADSGVFVNYENIRNRDINLTELGNTDWMMLKNNVIRKAATPWGDYTSEYIDLITGGSWEKGEKVGMLGKYAWHYQSFVPSITDKLNSLTITIFEVGTPSTLLATLYEGVGADAKALTSCSVPLETIQNGKPINPDRPDAGKTVRLSFEERLTLEAGKTYTLALTQETLSDTDYYKWNVAYNNPNSFPSGRIHDNGYWEAKVSPCTVGVYIGDPSECVDLVTGGSWEKGEKVGMFGKYSQHYQSFVPTVTNYMHSLMITIFEVGNPSNLTATLYEGVGAEAKALASCVVPAETVKNGEPINKDRPDAGKYVFLDFGEEITLMTGVTYTLALGQETLSDTDYYKWNVAYNNPNSFPSGRIHDNGYWESKVSPCTLQVYIGDPDGIITTPEPASTMQFRTFGGFGEKKTEGSDTDYSVGFTWTDGVPDKSANNSLSYGIMLYEDGSYTGKLPGDAGWGLVIPASTYVQTLSLVVRNSNCLGNIKIYTNDSAEPAYISEDWVGDAKTNAIRLYTVTIAPNTEVEVRGLLDTIYSRNGNMTLNAAALNTDYLEEDPNYQEGFDYVSLLRQTVEEMELEVTLWRNDPSVEGLDRVEVCLSNAKAALDQEGLTNEEAYAAYIILQRAMDEMIGKLRNAPLNELGGLSASFGWEGDVDAPIAWINGSYSLRGNFGKQISFGVAGFEPKSVKWYNAEGYLPCFVTEASKGGLDYKIENFADLVIIDGNKFEIAYSRMTVVNRSENPRMLPIVSNYLTPLNDAAVDAKMIAPGETVVRDYCIGADRFGGSYDFPAGEVLAAQGSFDAHYAHMKTYWNTRLDGIINIKSVPAAYAELINAYKAGYIYTLIISDGYELHVGENGYDRVFDHDVIGMLATLVESGHTENFAEFAQYLKQDQYPDAAWKYSWPFALYLQKTGDIDTILQFWNDRGFDPGIQTYTRKIGAEREVFDENLLDADGNPARIMMRTDAIDSYGYWTIDNWAALFGLTTYSYLCDQLYAATGEQEYKDEYNWAKAEYDSLVKGVEAVLKNTMDTYGFDYIPISMIVPNELSARKDLRDGNWLATYLFGRWDWDGYLFGAPQDSWLLDLTDATYDYVTTEKSKVFDSVYNIGGYPHGYFSSAYNAGYFSAALSGETWRDGGIEAYLWMINNSMGGLYGWWEGIAYPSDSTIWDRDCSTGGGGSCQHMWGQSTCTKVLIDSFFAEKADGTVIAGRGLPAVFNASGETIEVENYLCNAGKRIGFTMKTIGNIVTFTLTGDELANPVSLELPALANNIASVSGELSFDNASGSILIPTGTKTVTITMKQAVLAENEALQAVDGLTGEKLGALSAEELAGQDLTELASKLNCLTKTVDGVTYAFAGWFTEPQTAGDYADWTAKSVKNVTLAADDSTIYAWYINAGYLDTTIAYTSNASRASKVFAISTAPADLFANYGFVLSTAPSASDENLVIGGKIDGLNVAKLEKTTIYSWISVAPFSAAAPKTANDFNGGLGGVHKDGTDGYISYGMVTNMPIGKTISARAYYTTLDGTIVYGSTVQQLLEANSNVTGLE